ncbi:unnamed protein product, partial [Staurois parvus]
MISPPQTPLRSERDRATLARLWHGWPATWIPPTRCPAYPPHGEGMRAARALARFAQMSPGEDGSSLGSHSDVGAFGQRSKRVNRRSMEGLRVKVTRSEAPPSPTTPPPLGEISFERFDPPGAARWSEFLSASSSGRMESEFALLTLSDHEQRELYEAARVIQTAFRKYKGRRLKEQQDLAAAVIQRCYRKYKQYALYKKMTQAAILIQSKFRSYYEQKRFQQSRRAAVLIQQCYRSYREGARGGPALQSHQGVIPDEEAGPGCQEDHAISATLQPQDEGIKADSRSGVFTEAGAGQI